MVHISFALYYLGVYRTPSGICHGICHATFHIIEGQMEVGGILTDLCSWL